MKGILRILIRLYCQHSPFDKGKYRLAFWAFQHIKSPSVSVRARLGKSLQVELNPADLVQSQIYYIGYYELYLAKWFCHIIKPTMLFADVGAHIGQYTLLAAERGLMVHSFEPNPDNFARLKRNVTLNSFARVVLNQVAVSDHVGTEIFYLPNSSNTGSGSLKSILTSSDGKVSVKTITLDNYFVKLAVAPQIIKMDIEGAELLALHGLINTLRSCSPILILEASEMGARAFGYNVDDLVEFLRGFDYQIFVHDRNTLKPMQVMPRLNYSNLICLPNH